MRPAHFAEDTADAVASLDPDLFEIDDVGRQRSKGRGLAQCPVRAVAVVERLYSRRVLIR